MSSGETSADQKTGLVKSRSSTCLKAGLTGILAVLAVVLGAVPELALSFGVPLANKLMDNRLFRQTGWLAACIFALSALIGTQYWKPGSKLFRRIVTTISTLGLLAGLLWLFQVLLFLGGIPGLP